MHPWESSCLPSENLFPGLEYLEIYYCCRDVKFEPSIPRSARYIISGRRLHEWSFRCPSFKQVMGLSTSASSKLEIKYIIGQLSCESFDSLRQLDCEELTVDTCSNPVPLPECIQDWKSLRRYWTVRTSRSCQIGWETWPLSVSSKLRPTGWKLCLSASGGLHLCRPWHY